MTTNNFETFKYKSDSENSVAELTSEFKTVTFDENDAKKFSWTPGQAKTFELFDQKKNIFLTGAAGTGKSAVVHALTKRTTEYVAITSTTGVSATLVGGCTIHRWAGIFKNYTGYSTQQIVEDMATGWWNFCRKWQRKPELSQIIATWLQQGRVPKRWKSCSVLVIDEISMMTPEMFRQLDGLARYFRSPPVKSLLRKSKTENLPFGGIQLIAVGDFMQLPPIPGKDLYGRPVQSNETFCFETQEWADCFPDDSVVYLKKNMRQGNTVFQKCLNRVRTNRLRDETKALLQSRQGVEPDAGGVKPTEFYTTNAKVTQRNDSELRKLPGKSVVFNMTVSARRRRRKPKKSVETSGDQCQGQEEFDIDTTHKVSEALISDICKRRSIVERKLDLKPGAQVMLICNLDVENGLSNGTRGVVVAVSDKGVHCDFLLSDGTKHREFVEKNEWTVKPVDPKGEPATYLDACVSQIPLKLAWAITIHKSQGMSLTCAKIDLSGSFQSGMDYVALSRVRSLEGLFISEINFDKIKAHPIAKKFYRRLKKL